MHLDAQRLPPCPLTLLLSKRLGVLSLFSQNSEDPLVGVEPMFADGVKVYLCKAGMMALLSQRRGRWGW